MKNMPIIIICMLVSLLQAAETDGLIIAGGDQRPAEDIALAKEIAAVVAEPIEAGPVLPTKESIEAVECPEWFRDAKFGIWSHWGPGCVSEVSQNYSRDMYSEGHWAYKHHLKTYGDPTVVGYKDIIQYWTADKWEPEKLMKKFKAAGARYFVSISRHHDNFDLFDSKYTRWNAVKMGPKKDVMGIWRQAALKEGLRFGISDHSHPSFFWGYLGRKDQKQQKFDSSDPKYWSLYHAPPGTPGAETEYLNSHYARLKDAIDNYHPDLLYFDGGIVGADTHGNRIVAHYFNHNIKRHGGENQAVLNTKKGHGGVKDLERSQMTEIMPYPWQCDTSESAWFYMNEAAAADELFTIHRSSTTILHDLIDIVSKNGNLLLNIPQRADGTIDEHCEILLDDFAEWMAVNSESIFETRPWKVYGEGPSQLPRTPGRNNLKSPLTSKDIRFTQTKDGKTVYAFVLGIPRDTVRIKSFASEKIASIKLLGSNAKLEWKQTPNELEIKQVEKWPCRHAVVFKITLKQ